VGVVLLVALLGSGLSGEVLARKGGGGKTAVLGLRVGEVQVLRQPGIQSVQVDNPSLVKVGYSNAAKAPTLTGLARGETQATMVYTLLKGKTTRVVVKVIVR
jgi:hypothetical protein